MALRVMVAGAIAAHPLGGGGNTWAFLQYVLGFRRLGCDTYYVEHVDAAHCIDDDWQRVPFALSANARYFRSVMERFGCLDHAALLEQDDGGHIGIDRRTVAALARDADLFVNLSGRFHLTDILHAPRRRAYVDLDPGFVQIWREQYGVDMNFAGHDVYLSVGLNLGAPGCPMPLCGIDWHTTLPPVVLDWWHTAQPPGTAYTTVADWRGYSPVEWQGVWYGQKAEEFARLMELPRRVAVPLEICLAIHPDEPDRAALIANGWRLAAPRQHAATPDAYRDYIFASRGEFTAVKHGYAAGRTGWFSDRSACYLAAGRPVINQDTAFGSYLPTGKGLFAFQTMDDILAAVDEIESDYEGNCRAAREIATEYFGAEKVLASVLSRAGL